MSSPEIVIWLVVLAVGWAFARGGNLTAGALILSWITGQIVYLITGNNLPVEFYLYPDVFVLCVIFVKPDRSTADWIVTAIFPVQWYFYVAVMHDYHRWWALYILVLAQLLAAGIDSYLSYRRTRAVSHTPDKPTGAEFLFAFARRGYG